MESANPKGWNRLRVEYDNVGFFNGYYVRKGYKMGRYRRVSQRAWFIVLRVYRVFGGILVFEVR